MKKKSNNNYSSSNNHERAIAQKKKDKRQKSFKRFLIAVLCLALIGVGYTGMDIYITRHAVPAENINIGKNQKSYLSKIDLALNATLVDSISLDGSIMLESVIEEVHTNAHNSIIFDAKRSDGTIGYASNLASIDTYGATSNASSNPKASTKTLLEYDILPVARIACYKDNVAPAQNGTLAIMQGDRYYTKNGNTYLNPNSEDAYAYIRDIIRELNTFGVTIFVLSDCDLPDELGDQYKDGFKALSTKLTNDLGTGVKFIEQVDVEVTGVDPADGKITNKMIKKEISDFPKLGDNQIYCVTTKLDNHRVEQLLKESNVSSYFIGE